MAKKKKKNNKSQNKDSIKPVYLECKDDKWLMSPSTMYGDKEHINNVIPFSCLWQEIEDDVSSYSCYQKMDVIKRITDNEKSIQQPFQRTAVDYLNKHKMDQALNIFKQNAVINTACDVLDFTKYGDDNTRKNVLKDAVNILRKQTNVDDISLLWSTNEHVYIKYSASCEFAIKRLGYDANTKSVSYEIVAYEKQILFRNEIITVPCYIVQYSIGLIDTDDVICDSNSDNENDKANWTTKSWLNMNYIQNLMSGNCEVKSNNCVFPYIQIEKMSTIENIINDCRKMIKNDMSIKNEMRTTITNLFINVAINLFSDKLINNDTTLSHYAAYLKQKLSIPLACIIIANNMLMTEKLSKPSDCNKQYNQAYIKNVINNTTTEQPIRKTRHINNISIVSQKRPMKPTMQKIIKYSISEWNRRGFMRHYKNGKVVEIRPTTVRRQCVDASTLPSAKNQKCTNYIVHSDKK